MTLHLPKKKILGYVNNDTYYPRLPLAAFNSMLSAQNGTALSLFPAGGLGVDRTFVGCLPGQA